ncbi:MAG: signal recognition particle-docking protein FtsY [Clostridiales bacterium]|nr:signal recognition particle-docking protein FtsY [Clostridiales bacterium]MDY4036961.1 signal recognition particle-docking protein FtsY [Candidatus Pseudoscilispira sp.]
MGFFDKLKKAFSGSIKLDEDFFEAMEETLILGDLGVGVATDAVEQLRTAIKKEHLQTEEEVRDALRRILTRMLQVGDTALDLSTRPSVVMMIGVNGVGKTTTIGKLGYRLRGEGKKVLFCASDTFRAAAADQLEIWSERAGADIVRQNEGSDPGAVLFDAMQAAKARHTDVVLVDTAGRLHNKQNLMNELSKLRKIVDREAPEAAKETLLILDATTGQNGLIQAKQFKETAGLTGIVLTKLDGTAKGGIVVAIARELQVPVKFIGVGEGMEDLKPFDAEAYVRELV